MEYAGAAAVFVLSQLQEANASPRSHPRKNIAKSASVAHGNLVRSKNSASRLRVSVLLQCTRPACAVDSSNNGPRSAPASMASHAIFMRGTELRSSKHNIFVPNFSHRRREASRQNLRAAHKLTLLGRPFCAVRKLSARGSVPIGVTPDMRSSFSPTNLCFADFTRVDKSRGDAFAEPISKLGAEDAPWKPARLEQFYFILL